MTIDEDIKRKLRKVLGQYKDQIEGVKDSLEDLGEAKETIKHLRDAEFSLMSAMHEVSWIGLKHEKEEEIQKEVLQHTNEDNPSA